MPDWLSRPLRGHARSHRYCTRLGAGGGPVGAALAAKGPVQAMQIPTQHTLTRPWVYSSSTLPDHPRSPS
ncbi:hypothetical protein EGN69_01325 [Pseudomonas monteilii]|nr:hypothetical protein EGN69_01325 [Pseudomonas monteilii]